VGYLGARLGSALEAKRAPFCELSLKGEVQGELDLAGRPGGFVDDTEARAEQGVRRQSEIHNIENVEELRAKLQDRPFGAAVADGSVLDQSEIVLLEAGAAKSIAPERAKVALIGAGPTGKIDGNRKEGAVVCAAAEVILANGATGG